MEKSEFIYVTYIRATPEKLWQALTDPEFTRRYWFETYAESTWKPRASWRAMNPDHGVICTGEIIENQPHRRLVQTWQHEKTPELRAEGPSRLTYEIEKMGESVKLTVIHEMNKSNSKSIQSVSGGWPMVLASLKSLLETGEPLEATRRWLDAGCADKK